MKIVYFTLGLLSFVLGIIGAFLPVLPTTPLMILSAYFFSKSYPPFETYILNLPVIGEMIKKWRVDKIISKRAKASSCLVLSLFIGISIWKFEGNILIQLILFFVASCVMLFILTRNSE